MNRCAAVALRNGLIKPSTEQSLSFCLLHEFLWEIQPALPAPDKAGVASLEPGRQDQLISLQQTVMQLALDSKTGALQGTNMSVISYSCSHQRMQKMALQSCCSSMVVTQARLVISVGIQMMIGSLRVWQKTISCRCDEAAVDY